MSAPAVFLDRDGTIIEDVGYPRNPEQVNLLPGAPQALARLQRSGFRLVIVSNQSGVGRGIVTPAEAEAVHQRTLAELERREVLIDGFHYCPHAPWEGCTCRKPAPTMLLRAAETLNISLRQSFMVGDKVSDIEAGRRAGCQTVLLGVETADNAPANFVAADWSQVARFIASRGAAAG